VLEAAYVLVIWCMRRKTVTKRRVAVVGAGGHGRVIADILSLHSDVQVVGFLDDDPGKRSQVMDTIRVIACVEDAIRLKKSRKIDGVVLAVGNNRARARLFARMVELGVPVFSAIHPVAVLARGVTMGEGFVAMAGVVINPGALIGANVCVNTGAVLDHDTVLEDHVHIFPGARLTGGVRVERYAYVSSGAIVAPYLKVGENATVAAGAVVLENVAPHTVVAGVPARLVRAKDPQRLGSLR
jgi:sugar O-acyltransferase (sialic acid O-acetyltransferase NeuD family)